MNFTATYSPEDDKLRLYCGRVDAETFARLRKVRFQRAYKQECFYVVWNPAAEDLCMELAGEVTDEDSSLVERAEARADRFEGYSVKRTAEAESAHAAVSAIADNIPLGQPILVGHHSERHARRDAERIENGMRKALKLWDTASYWTDRAAGALRHAKYLERPDVRARRIKGLESDIRVYRSKFTPIGEPILQHRWNDPADAPKVPHMFCAPRGGRGGHYVPVEDLPAIERHYTRWIKHAENRLAYEKAMLNEQGASDLLKRKPKSAAASLPLCNYRAPEGIDVPAMYTRGQIDHYPQKDMTAAEYARIHPEYKGTRVVNNSHRVRTAVLRLGERVCVFITDAKTHIPPEAIAPAPISEPRRFPVMVSEPSDVEKKISQLRAAVNAGVKVVSAPQLFPTPPELAERMVSLADIRPGHRVLEPSAGTGRILAALPNVRPGGEVVAVEINYNLAKLLEEIADDTRNCDFLECNGDLGKFDRILMNPPFSNGDDIKHITHAVNFLAPGGLLVAICAGGPRQHERLKPIAATWEPLPAGTFEESGTGVSTVLLTITAPEAEPEATPQPRTLTGQTLSLFPLEGEQ
jgi:protein-L-isoaspartate O-methyltransferase